MSPRPIKAFMDNPDSLAPVIKRVPVLIGVMRDEGRFGLTIKFPAKTARDTLSRFVFEWCVIYQISVRTFSNHSYRIFF